MVIQVTNDAPWDLILDPDEPVIRPDETIAIEIMSTPNSIRLRDWTFNLSDGNFANEQSYTALYMSMDNPERVIFSDLTPQQRNVYYVRE